MVALCVGIFLVHIWSRTFILKRSYEIGDLKKQAAQLDSEIAEKTVERNSLFSSGNLERWVERLATKGQVLMPPKADQVVYVRSSENSKQTDKKWRE
jgi:hypothetical protein